MTIDQKTAEKLIEKIEVDEFQQHDIIQVEPIQTENGSYWLMYCIVEYTPKSTLYRFQFERWPEGDKIRYPKVQLTKVKKVDILKSTYEEFVEEEES